MPAGGGPVRRLTFLGCAIAKVAGWDPRGQRVVFASHVGQPFLKSLKLLAVSPKGGMPEPLPFGPAQNVSFGPKGGVVLGRHTADPARWKRYRGGTAGQLWIDATGKGTFTRLAAGDGNPACPMWVGGRIYFLAPVRRSFRLT